MFPKHLSCFRNMWFWHTGRSIDANSLMSPNQCRRIFTLISESFSNVAIGYARLEGFNLMHVLTSQFLKSKIGMA